MVLKTLILGMVVLLWVTSFLMALYLRNRGSHHLVLWIVELLVGNYLLDQILQTVISSQPMRVPAIVPGILLVLMITCTVMWQKKHDLKQKN